MLGPFAAMRRMVEVFEQLEIRYLIGGSVATMLYGVPRLTRDVDFVAEIGLEHVKPIVTLLGQDFYVDGSMIQEAINRRSSFNVIYLATMDKADVFVARADQWGRTQLERRVFRHPDPDQPDFGAYFSSPEDNLLNKLLWYQLGGGSSTLQWNDMLGVLKVQSRALDFAYLRHWAAELKVQELLTQLLEDADLG